MSERVIAGYLTSHAVAVAASIASLVMVVRLFESRRTSQSIVAWLLAIVFMPFIAIPLYLAIGSRKFPRRAKGPTRESERIAAATEYPEGPMARVSRAAGVPPPRPGNAFQLLTTGEAAYARLMALIREAHRSIDLTMFILGDDATGRAVVDALAARAAGGVAVRVILDAVGSRTSRGHATRTLHAVGGEVRTFMPLRHSPVRGRTNLRSHRKLGVFDGQHVFAGGMNLAVEYMGPDPPPAANAPRWRDVAAVASGDVAPDAEALFESDWVFCGGSRRARDAGDAAAPGSVAGVSRAAPGDAIVQIVPSGPDMITDTVYDLFLTGIFAARERISIVTPYYVPDELLQHALVLAARRGVLTELVIPARSNHGIADMARRALLRELLAAGVVVHYYMRGMVHAKAMAIDTTFAYVGSPNFDMRSLFLNYEDALCLYSPGAIGQVRAFIDGLIAECITELPPERTHWLRAGWLVERLARILAPEL